MANAAVNQAILQAATSGLGVTASSQAVMQVAYAPPATFANRSTLFVAQANYLGRGVPVSAQLVVQVAYRIAPTENLTARVWTFTLDGHEFYVITLGEQGTWVYDRSTGEWSNWETAGYGSWNMERGITWKGDVIAADRENAVIWKLNPGSFIDNDFKSQTRKVSGAIALRGTQKVPNFDFRITASTGKFDVASTLPATVPSVTLSVSDDQGNTFTDMGFLTIETANFTQELSWRSLGDMQAPGRIFQITDVGAIARLDGADASVGED